MSLYICLDPWKYSKSQPTHELYVRWPLHPVKVTIRDNKDHLRVLSFSYYTSIIGWGRIHISYTVVHANWRSFSGLKPIKGSACSRSFCSLPMLQPAEAPRLGKGVQVPIRRGPKTWGRFGVPAIRRILCQGLYSGAPDVWKQPHSIYMGHEVPVYT